MPEACPVYRPRQPHLTPFCPCVQDHLETLENFWPERFQKRYGFRQPHLKEVMVHYLAAYLVRVAFSQKRMDCCPRQASVV